MKHEILGDLVELLQLRGDDARAVGRRSDLFMLFEDDHIEALFRQEESRVEAGGTSAHDDDVEHGPLY